MERYDGDLSFESLSPEARREYERRKTVKEAAEDLGVSESMLYWWRQRYTAQGDKTQSATIEEELKALRLENAELKIERDMLKKAAACFVKLQK
ncbi:MAG: transposase [Synergistaceae bacterium]|jgi:transposase|nr:transposase [Synergistaceae bacterium]